MPGLVSFLSKRLPTFQIYGANTEVGKTIVSTILSLGIPKNSKKDCKVHYIKPISTGSLSDADIK